MAWIVVSLTIPETHFSSIALATQQGFVVALSEPFHCPDVLCVLVPYFTLFWLRSFVVIWFLVRELLLELLGYQSNNNNVDWYVLIYYLSSTAKSLFSSLYRRSLFPGISDWNLDLKISFKFVWGFNYFSRHSWNLICLYLLV